MIRYELFSPEKHYEEIVSWWKNQKWDAIPLSHLPKVGIIVYHSDKPSWAAWIYKTDSAFCILDWIVANPEIRKNERTETFNYLIDISKEISKNLGFKTIFTVTRGESLINRLKKSSFSEFSNSMAGMICNLGGT